MIRELRMLIYKNKIKPFLNEIDFNFNKEEMDYENFNLYESYRDTEENKFEKEKIYNAFEDIIDIDTKQFILELSCFANTQDIISRYDDWYEDDLKRGVIEDLFKQVIEEIKKVKFEEKFTIMKTQLLKSLKEVKDIMLVHGSYSPKFSADWKSHVKSSLQTYSKKANSTKKSSRDTLKLKY